LRLLTAKRPNKPTQTVLSDTQDGHSPGDVAIYLSDSLAEQANKMIQENQQCDTDAGTINMSGKAVKAGNDQPGPATGLQARIKAIVCVTRYLIRNGSPGMALAELASLDMKPSTWSSPDLAQAMNEIIEFATDQANNLMLSVEGAVTLAFGAFYLAYVSITNNIPLGRVNWISGHDLQGKIEGSSLPTLVSMSPTMSITAISSATSSGILECSASCTMVGRIKDCNTWCPTPTGDEQYTRPSVYAVKTVAFEPWVVMDQVPVEVPIGICPPPPENATEFPLDLFAPVYSKFCQDVDETKDNTTSVLNWKGEKHPSLKSRLLRLISRDEASDDEKYKDYKFSLGRFVRDTSMESCSISCSNAYEQLSAQDACKRGDDKKSIANTGILDAGCALYSFNIEVPKPRIEIKCSDSKGPFSAPKYDSAASGGPSVESAIKGWCTEHGLTQIKSNSPQNEPYGRWPITQLDVPNRSSFWRATRLHGNNELGIILFDECLSAFAEGFKQCEPDSERSHGFTALLGSMEYSLEVNGWTQEGNPPWDQETSFPPSEDSRRPNGDPYGPDCGRTYDGREAAKADEIHRNDFEQALEAFCRNGQELKEDKKSEHMFKYPPDGQPPFYASDKSAMDVTLRLGAQPAPDVYDDANSCQ
jgi:hypothetical protein